MNKEFITFLVVKYRVISMLVTKENKTKENVFDVEYGIHFT